MSNKSNKKKNHYVPRWLLRNFSRSDQGDGKQIWMFRKGVGPIPTNVIDAGHANYFYGNPDNCLEDLLEKFDTRDSDLLSVIVDGGQSRRSR